MSASAGGYRAEAGSALLLAVLLTVALAVLSVSMLGWVASGGKRAAVEVGRAQALYLAESGVAEALYRLNGRSLAPPAPGDQVEFSSGEALGWGKGSYHVVVSRASEGGLVVESTGVVGDASRRVTVRLRLQSLVPAEVFSPGPEGDGVRATDAQDPRYDPALDPPPVGFRMPPLPSPVIPWDGRNVIGTGTYVFDRIEVADKKSLEIRADGRVDVYVAGFVSVGNKAELRCVGAGPVRFFLYGDPAGPRGQALYLGNQAVVHAEGPTVWTINGGVLLDQHARFTQGSAAAPASLNIRGSLLVEGHAVLGSEPGKGEAPRVLVVLEPAGAATALELEQHAEVYAMIYAPDADVNMEQHSLLAGALVCHSLALDKHAECSWNEAIAGLKDGSGWELLAGWWEVETGTWSAR